jgi:hypothetical protein
MRAILIIMIMSVSSWSMLRMANFKDISIEEKLTIIHSLKMKYLSGSSSSVMVSSMCMIKGYSIVISNAKIFLSLRRINLKLGTSVFLRI